ncbi:asparaginase [Pseudonocardia parietis]|uniref:L-asparaginase n=1 Tax=Pseudonocardia parietis TaxID=570936 RepID=A0ABS4W036_9PSEU|nr:asparaginase [Pseudonocardia parietis]MBP2369577.1 L-asparaginase [Pseudonocardia parietis]
MSDRLPRVLVVTLGGTIASVPDRAGHDAVPRLGPDELIASVPGAEHVATLRTESFRQFPSGDLSVADVVALAQLIHRRGPDLDGVVVTQGTDTLEETSYLLELLLDRDAPPVVLTGAMRNAGLAGADGPGNLLAALRVAASPEARGAGPLVVFADEIHLPRFVRKQHSSRVHGFGSVNAGPVGWVVEERVRIPLLPRRRGPVCSPDSLPAELPAVGVIRVGLGSGPILPEHVTGFAGLVVDAFGGGHVPSPIVASLAAVAERIPVVMASRTGAGEVYESTYAFPGSERDLLERGLISAVALDGIKARLQLILLLASGADRDEIRARYESAV